MGNRGLGIRMTTIVSPLRFGPLISDNVPLLIKELVRSFLAFAICLSPSSPSSSTKANQCHPFNTPSIRRLPEKYHVLIIKGREWWSMRSFVIVQTMALRHCGTRNNEGVKLLMYPSLCSF